MTKNQHIADSAVRLSCALQTLNSLGLTVAQATIGSRNPVIRLAEPPRGRQLAGATRVRRNDGATITHLQVALIDRCQIEWEVRP